MSFVSSKVNILCRFINIELYKIFVIINRAIKGLHCSTNKGHPGDIFYSCYVLFVPSKLTRLQKWLLDDCQYRLPTNSAAGRAQPKLLTTASLRWIWIELFVRISFLIESTPHMASYIDTPTMSYVIVMTCLWQCLPCIKSSNSLAHTTPMIRRFKFWITRSLIPNNKLPNRKCRYYVYLKW